VCYRYVGTELNILQPAVFLSVLNITNCCVGSVCLYWIVQILVCSLSVGPEQNLLLFLVCFRHWTIQIGVSCLSLGTEIYTLLFVVCLSVIDCTHSCLWFVCRYRTVLIAMCGLSVCTNLYLLLYAVSVVTEFYTLLCVVSLSLLNVHIYVCGLSFGT